MLPTHLVVPGNHAPRIHAPYLSVLGGSVVGFYRSVTVYALRHPVPWMAIVARCVLYLLTFSVIHACIVGSYVFCFLFFARAFGVMHLTSILRCCRPTGQKRQCTEILRGMKATNFFAWRSFSFWFRQSADCFMRFKRRAHIVGVDHKTRLQVFCNVCVWAGTHCFRVTL